ncbi:MAG: TnpV protein [Clostridia bacterium]|nr:TnpV protein [Clostridia bacterium]
MYSEAKYITKQINKKVPCIIAWVGAMNSIRNRSEEIVLREMIYGKDAV